MLYAISSRLRRASCALFSVLLIAAPAVAAPKVENVAGTGQPENNGAPGPALKTNIGDPFGVEIGPDSALYITEVRNHRVWRLNRKTNQLTVVAGTGDKGYSGDGGPATSAKLNEPYEVRFDRAGNMIFVEMQNHVIRRVDAKTKTITTIAGTGKKGFAGDGGPATQAQFVNPHSIALDAEDNIYVADIGNHRIRRIDAKTGAITTIAGNGEKKLPVDGQTAAGKPMLGPRALYIADGVLWIALREGHSIWRMKLSDGVLHHVAGTGKKGYSGDGGPAAEATLNGPKGIAISLDGDVYIADTENHAIRRIDGRSGKITTLAGRSTGAMLNRPHGVCVDDEETVYIGDTLSNFVRGVSAR